MYIYDKHGVNDKKVIIRFYWLIILAYTFSCM